MVAVTIAENDTASDSITLTVNPAAVSEGVGVLGEAVTVTAMLNAAVRTTATEVTISVAGGTAAADDFVSVTDFTLTVAALATSGTADFTLIPEDDDVAEGNETVTVSGTTAASGLTVATPGATVTITDNDKASSSIALSVNPAAVSEGVGASGETVTVTAMLNAGARTTDTEVTVSVAAGTAAEDDFAAVTDFTLTIPAEATSGEATFTLIPVDDGVAEGNETVTVSGTTTTSGLTVGTPGAAVTITDDDMVSSSIALSVNPAAVSEGVGASGETVTVTAMLNAGARTTNTEVTVTVSAGTASAAADFTVVMDFTLTIQALATSGTADFTLFPVDDDVAEGDETVTVSGTTTASGLTVATPGPTVTITDNDTVSTRIDLSVSHTRVAEDAAGTLVTVTAMLNAGVRTTDTEVTVSVEPGTADAGDFTPVASFPLTILATETSDEATFTLTPSADRLEEGDETIAVRGTVTGVSTLRVNPATITLTDVFTASRVVTLSVTPATVSESVGSGGQLVNVTAELDEGARDAATVIQVSVAGSGAAGVVDFTPVASFPLTIPANHTGGAATFSLKPVDDDVDEDDETLTVSGTTTAAGLTVNAATLMLTDDDTASSSIALSVNPAALSEGVGISGAAVTVTAMLNAGARTTDTEVTVSVAAGTASADDFTAVTDFTLTILALATSGTADFTLIPVDDDVAEGNETVTVSGTTTSGLTVATPGATVTITDNDMASSTIALSVNPEEVSEGVGVPGATVTVTAILNAGARLTATEVTISVTASTASASDFTAVTDFTLTIPALATSGTAEFTLFPVDDDVAEGNETVTVSGTTAASGLTVATPGATVTITDNDVVSSSITLSVNPAVVSEGVGASGAPVTVNAMLNAGARTTDTEVTVSVAAGTASEDDFAAVTNFTLTIPALATSGMAEFTLFPVDDDVAESNETVTVSGTAAASGLTVVTPGATVTITDNDTVTVSFETTASTVEEGENATFTVTLSGKAASDVVLGWITGGVGDTATSDDDYTVVTAGRLTFLPAGALTQTIMVTTLQDMLAEASETFTVTLTELVLPDGVTLGTAMATGTITDDDTLTAAVTAGAATVAEGTKASFPVKLTGGTSTADVMVTYTVTGTATAGTDYTAPGGTLTIPARNASGTIEIQTAADDVLDASETLVVTLTKASTTKGTAAVDPAAATTAITDVGSLTVSESSLTVTEGDATGADYTVVLDSRPTGAVTVTVSGASETDLTVSPASLTFTTGDWDQPKTVTVTADEDEDAVADDAVTLTHTAKGGGYDGVTGDSVTVTIAEDDIVIPSNLVSVTADAPHGLYVYNGRKGSLREVPPGMYDDGPAPYVYEGEEATFTVTLSEGAATAAVEVSYEVGGEVTPGRDYTAPAGTLRIPRGSASETIRIQTFLDVNGLTEFPERLEVTLTGATSTSGAVGVDPAGAEAMLLLWEGKKRWVFVAESTVTEYPTAEWAYFNVSLSRRLPVDVEVHWRTRDGTAKAGEDYKASTGTVIMPAGTAGRDDEVRLLNDDIAEDTETFKVELTGTNFPEMVVEFPEGGWDSADLTIRDDDRLRASVTADPETVSEGAEASFPVTLTGGTSAADVVVSYTVTGTAMAETDYTAQDGILTIPAGIASGTITVQTAYDDVIDPDETLVLTLTGASTEKGKASVDARAASATATIKDPDTLSSQQQKVLTLAFVADVAVTSSPANREEYVADEAIVVKVQFSQPVIVDTGVPSIALMVGGASRMASYESGSGSENLVFTYTVTAEDSDTDEVRVVANSLSLNGGTIRDEFGTDVDPSYRMIRVADARAEEGLNATIGFTVTLSAASDETVSVTYETVDGTARASEDYEAASGTLVFAPGVTDRIIQITVLDDAKDEGEEMFTLRLSSAMGAALADAEATGTIVNSDHLQQAWLVRFGRTVAGHVVEAVSERLTTKPVRDSHVKIGGYQLGPSTGTTESVKDDQLWGYPEWGHWTEEDQRSVRLRSLTSRELLLGSSFHLSSDEDEAQGTRWSAWGQAAQTRFDGKQVDVSVDGDIFTGIAGVEGDWDQWVAGMAFSHSEGEGSFAQDENGGGTVESSLTGVHPYLRYNVNERVSLWGLLGRGQGEFRLTEDRTGILIETDIDMNMAAIGARGALLSPSENNGFELAVRSDVFWMAMQSDAVESQEAGRFESAEANASRFRLILEGSRAFDLGSNRTLTPSLDLGLRNDGGDGETGTGLEVGAGIRYADTERGLTIEGAVRGFFAQEEDKHEEWGVRGSIRVDPGASGQGFSFTLSPVWGTASSGVDRLWSLRDLADFTNNDNVDPTGRILTEMGYGFSIPSMRGLLTPFAALNFADDDSLQSRVGIVFERPARTNSRELSVELAAGRTENRGGESENRVDLKVRMGFPNGRVATQSVTTPKWYTVTNDEAITVPPASLTESNALEHANLLAPFPSMSFAAAPFPAKLDTQLPKWVMGEPSSFTSFFDPEAANMPIDLPTNTATFKLSDLIDPFPPPMPDASLSERTKQEQPSIVTKPIGKVAVVPPSQSVDTTVRRQTASLESATVKIVDSTASTESQPKTSRKVNGSRKYFVQLGAFSKYKNAVRAEAELVGDLADILTRAEYTLKIDTSKGDGLSRVIFTDAFTTRDLAVALCTSIKKREKDCYVTRAW